MSDKIDELVEGGLDGLLELCQSAASDYEHGNDEACVYKLSLIHAVSRNLQAILAASIDDHILKEYFAEEMFPKRGDAEPRGNYL